jgi:hypothetical protein
MKVGTAQVVLTSPYLGKLTVFLTAFSKVFLETENDRHMKPVHLTVFLSNQVLRKAFPVHLK